MFLFLLVAAATIASAIVGSQGYDEKLFGERRSLKRVHSPIKNKTDIGILLP